LWFIFLEDFPLGVVTDDLAVDEATKIKLRSAEGRSGGHRGRLGVETDAQAR
jgi:hypothetical protein